ncbi:MAG TPA: PAS domain S-box protein [Planctomycetota bacterium]
MQSVSPVRPATAWARATLFCLAYFACAVLASFLSLKPGPFANFWLPSGLFVATLLLNETRQWPVFLLAALPANVGFDLLCSHPFFPSLLFYCGNCLAAVGGAWLVRRYVERPIDLSRARDVIGLVFFAAMGSTTLSAAMGTSVVAVADGVDSYWDTWVLWWSNNVLGVLVLAPVLLTWWPASGTSPRSVWPAKTLEAIVATAIIVLCTVFICDPRWHGNFAVDYLLIPLVMWPSIRWGPRGAALAGFGIALIAAWYATQGHSATYVLGLSPREAFASLQLFLTTVAFVGLFTAAMVSARKRELDALRESDERFRTAFDCGAIAMALSAPDGRLLKVNAAFCQMLGFTEPDLLARDFYSITHPEDAPANRAGVARMLRGEQNSFRMEKRYIRSDGGIVWGDMSTAFLRDLKGRPTYMITHVQDITETKRAEEAVRRSENKYRRLHESMTDAFVSVDMNGRIQEFNHSYQAMLGYSEDELRSLSYEDLTPPQWHEHEARIVHELILSRGYSEVYEKEYRRKDGTVFPVELRTFLLRDESGKPEAMWAIVRDITDRKQTEALLNGQRRVLELVATRAPLRDSLAALVQLIEAHASGMLGSILLLDEDGVHLRHGAAPSLPLEYTNAIDGAAIGPNAGSCGTAAYRGEAVFVENIATDPLWNDYKALALPHGLLACWSTPIFDAQRRVLGTFAMYYRQPALPQQAHRRLIDLATHIAAIAIGRHRIETSLRESTEQLRQSEERLRNLVEQAADGIFVSDTQGRYLDVNSAGAAMLGYTREEILRLSIADVITSDEVPRLGPEISKFTGGQVVRSEWQFRRKDGSVFLGEVAGRQLPDGRLQGIVRDVTERKRAEEELKDGARRKDEFMAMLGHELRNPLAPIRNANEILKLLGTPDPRAQHAREMIERQITHLSRIVDDLLDVSRIARGKFALRQQRLDWAALVRACAEDFHQGIEARIITFNVLVPAEPVWVLGDDTRLSQVLSNLLANAQKFTDSGGAITVSLHAQAASQTAELVVQDTGIGMNAQILSRIFEPFAQAEKDLARSRGGLGLGLALVKGIVGLHGGTVNAASEGPERGSRFTVELPMVAPPMTSAGARLQPSHMRSLHVLVIEDNQDAADSTRMLLELDGHQVDTAPDGPRGLEKARSFNPDVILCDIGLPGQMDGYAVARRIRADPMLSAIYLVAMTGYGQEQDKRHAREAGFDVHLTKPADLAALERVLSAVPARERVLH